MSSIEKRLFGTLPSGEVIDEYTLGNGRGLQLKVITYGGIVTQLLVPDRTGTATDIVLGFDNLPQYLAGHPYFGAVIGRVAGRITGGRFAIDGKTYTLATNDPPNHLHGGNVGFDKRVWSVETAERVPRLTLSYKSPDGEEGYPGNVRVHVTYALTPDNEWTIDYDAVTDQPTPLSLTNHSYFNLAGEGNGGIRDHVLQIFADEYAPSGEHMTLKEVRLPVRDSANDFTSPQRLGNRLPQLWKNHGENYFIRPVGQGALAPVAVLSEPTTGRVMTVSSTAPCLQLYSGSVLDGSLVGKSGVAYGRHAALCLECQGYPNATNLYPGQTYRQTTKYAFSTGEPNGRT